MSIFIPREYQQRAIDIGISNLFGGGVKNGLILMPTGTGKSVVIGGTVKRIKELYAPARILMVTHNKELIEQNYKKAVAMYGGDIGLWSAGLGKKEHHKDIVFAGIDTIANKPELLASRDIILIDEAHRVAPQPHTSYRNVIEGWLYAVNPNAMTLGYTATDYRLGQGLLTDSWYDRKTKTEIEPFWQENLLDLTSVDEFNRFFDEGYLKRLVPKATHTEVDMSALRMRNGEYVQSDVEAEVNNETKIRAIVDEICEQGFDRRSWLVFGAGNKNAEMLGEEIARRGVVTAVLTEKTTAAERRRILDAYKRYEIRCIVNNDILTTGFDHEGVDLIAVVRVTASTALWVQMLGRGTRPVYAAGFDLSTSDGRLASIFASGVYNCLVLDFAGNSKRLGAINNPVKSEKPDRNRRKKDTGEIPVKICPSCGAYNSISARTCENIPDCGAEFPYNEQLVTEASERELIEVEAHVPDIRKLAVTSTYYRLREKDYGGGTTSDIVVTYSCGKLGKFTENLTFKGDASSTRIKTWWAHFGNGYAVPESNDYFIKVFANSEYLRKPKVLEVYMNPPRKSRPEIKYYGFEDASFFEVV